MFHKVILDFNLTLGKMMAEKPDDGSQHASKFTKRLLKEGVFVSWFMARDPLLMDNRP